ncbi:MAG TPA: 4-Cys prefix domain-containing protein [Oculatellaceae cyanobacterium]|jgi:serine/threonine-protein kinase
MLYCLNPDCSNPINPDGNNFCQSCRTGLVPLLRDRYRIISLLGSGGFGRTFLAEDTDTPSKRRCVIKQLKPIANNPQIYQIVQERFQREAAILEELGEDKQQIPR